MITSDYLASGGDGYSVLKESESVTKGEDALSLLERYFEIMSPVSPGDEGRTVDIARSKIITKDDCPKSGSVTVTTNSVVQLFLLAVALLVTRCSS